jgi:hypothetical protein
MLQAVATRPGSFALLAMAVFYLWVYVRRGVPSSSAAAKGYDQERSSPVTA